MKYIVQDSEGKKMIMSAVSSMPQLPEGFEVLGKAEDLSEVVDELELAASKEKQIEDAYRKMNEDIHAEMEKVFGTTSTDSATAYNETYKLMKEFPSDFIGGDLIDEAGVIAFAEEKLAKIKEYAIYRLERIKHFQNEKESILN